MIYTRFRFKSHPRISKISNEWRVTDQEWRLAVSTRTMLVNTPLSSTLTGARWIKELPSSRKWIFAFKSSQPLIPVSIVWTFEETAIRHGTLSRELSVFNGTEIIYRLAVPRASIAERNQWQVLCSNRPNGANSLVCDPFDWCQIVFSINNMNVSVNSSSSSRYMVSKTLLKTTGVRPDINY